MRALHKDQGNTKGGVATVKEPPVLSGDKSDDMSLRALSNRTQLIQPPAGLSVTSCFPLSASGPDPLQPPTKIY